MAAPLLLGIPLWMWIAGAGGLAAHQGLKGIEAYGQYKLGGRQIEAGVKGQELQAGIGKREEERMNTLMRQLLRFREKESLVSEHRASEDREAMMIMNLMQMAMPRPVKKLDTGGTFPPASLVGLLR